MLGAIIGDIVGSAYEFNRTNDYNFELFPSSANFTDDTICTIAVADALLRGRDFGESLHEWCRRYPNPKGGYGGRFSEWVRSDNFRPYNSLGNGSAMRVSPVGWWCDNPYKVLTTARASAECTHNHGEGIAGAQAVAAAIMCCRQWRKSTSPYVDKTITPENILKYGLKRSLDIIGIAQPDGRFELNLNYYRNRFDETCGGTVPVALYIVMTSTSFEDAVRRAVSLGADADTLGAIVGSIAEVIWGIPEWMKAKALSYLPEEMLNVLSRFRRHLRGENDYSKRFIPEWINDLKPEEVFVFGSNLAGHHGGGAARVAHQRFGAEWGVGYGMTGRCFAIPTMHGPLESIRPYVRGFIRFAMEHPHMVFLLTRIGCGIAGFTDKEMCTLFRGGDDYPGILKLPNVRFPDRWLPYLK